MNDRYLKFTWKMATDNTSSTHIANVIISSPVGTYSTSAYVLTDNGVSFTNRLFATLYTMLSTKLSAKIAYPPQTNEKVERYSRTLVKRLWHFIAEKL